MKHIYSALIFFLDNTAENEHSDISYFTLSDTKRDMTAVIAHRPPDTRSDTAVNKHKIPIYVTLRYKT